MEWLIELCIDSITFVSGIMLFVAYIYSIYFSTKDVDK